MSADKFVDILLDSLKDSGLVFGFVFLFLVLLSFIDIKISNFLVKRKKSGPVFGSFFGLIPQCGTSVLGADLYLKNFISIGTLSAILLSCSDEALIILLTSGGSKTIYALYLIGIKFITGGLFGLILDLIIRNQNIEQVDEIIEEETCSHHHSEKENTKIHKHLVHPFFHSFELFFYVLIINFLLGVLIGYIGEETFANFVSSSKYFAPLLSSIIGLIPNCASSVLLTELFIDSNLSFGGLVAGLLVNSGLGMMVLLKKKEKLKSTLLVLSYSFIIANVVGYLTCLIIGF